MNHTSRVHVFQSSLQRNYQLRESDSIEHVTSIWYKKYWINCFSNGREVNNRWRSVPKSSVTKYLEKLCSKVITKAWENLHIFQRRYEDVAQTDNLSIKLAQSLSHVDFWKAGRAYVFMGDVFEQLQLPICPLT